MEGVKKRINRSRDCQSAHSFSHPSTHRLPPLKHTHTHSLFSCFVPNPIEWWLPICWCRSATHTQILPWPSGVSQPLPESPPYLGCDVWGCNNARSCLEPFASPVESSKVSWSQVQGHAKVRWEIFWVRCQLNIKGEGLGAAWTSMFQFSCCSECLITLQARGSNIV